MQINKTAAQIVCGWKCSTFSKIPNEIQTAAHKTWNKTKVGQSLDPVVVYIQRHYSITLYVHDLWLLCIFVFFRCAAHRLWSSSAWPFCVAFFFIEIEKSCKTVFRLFSNHKRCCCCSCCSCCYYDYYYCLFLFLCFTLLLFSAVVPCGSSLAKRK